MAAITDRETLDINLGLYCPAGGHFSDEVTYSCVCPPSG